MRTNSVAQTHYKNLINFIEQIHKNYESIRINKIETKRFDVKYYHQVLDELVNKSKGLINSELAGKSFKGNDIKLVQFGEGKTKILMWSQMHGDESTASLALLDLINLLSNDKQLSNFLKSKISLFIIPILNPDGANKFERRNYQEIDINRDALRLQTPEGKLLKRIHDLIQPDFGFNLHDQYANYSVGKTGKPAAISILAPAVDYERNINEVRKKAIQVCIDIKVIIDKYYPGVVARYDDEFEPRAFGDNIQKWGTSTILIESGGYFKDYEKQEVRKMNYIALSGVLYSIASKSYLKNPIEKYFEIPENERLFFDLLVKNVTIQKDSVEFIVDLGINHEEKFDSLRNRYIKQYFVVDIGDLSTFFAYDSLDATNLKFEFGKVYEKILTNPDTLKAVDIEGLMKEGYTSIIYQGSYDKIEEGSLLDLMASSTKNPLRESRKILGHSANFVLKDTSGKVKFSVINGKVFKLN